jgi:hypothetical protein
MREYRQTIVTHLKTQLAQGLNAGGACCYRGEDGLKCAVGALIPDDQYTPQMDGSYSLREVMENCTALCEIEAKYPNLFDELHDWRDYHDATFYDRSGEDAVATVYLRYEDWLTSRDEVQSPEAMLAAMIRKYGE